MRYEDKISEVLTLAKNAKNEGDLDKLCSLEKSLATAQYYRSSNEPKAHRILDKVLRRSGTQ